MDRRNEHDRAQLEGRIRAEFDYMAGLSLTAAQACRLFHLDRDAGARILGSLVDRGFLRCLPDGSYVRVSEL